MGEIVTTRKRAMLVKMYEVMSITQVPIEKVASQLAREYREAGESCVLKRTESSLSLATCIHA